jgi:hypothetical protein
MDDHHVARGEASGGTCHGFRRPLLALGSNVAGIGGFLMQLGFERAFLNLPTRWRQLFIQTRIVFMRTFPKT